VDLEQFSPRGEEAPPEDRICILMVEGSLQGGYELGLQSAVALAEALQSELGKKVELAVAGRADEALKSKWAQTSRVSIEWLGVVPNEQIPALNRGAHFLYSADLNAACPNSVIEALACGLPVLAFDTGALKELVTSQAGRVVPYGGDPWKLDPPDIRGLVSGAVELMQAQTAFRKGARGRAEAAFGLDTMVDAYIRILGWTSG
jgi:glycosyltransferase involved in cell wall biosynthesis